MDLKDKKYDMPFTVKDKDFWDFNLICDPHLYLASWFRHCQFDFRQIISFLTSFCIHNVRDILSYQSWQISLTKQADKILISPRTARQGKEDLREEISRRWWQEFAGGFTAFGLHSTNMNRNPRESLKFRWQQHLPTHTFLRQYSPTADQMSWSLCRSHVCRKATIWVLLWYKTNLGIYSLVLRVLWGSQLLFLQEKLRNASILA